MNNSFKPTNDDVWSKLAKHKSSLQKTTLVDLFNNDSERFASMHSSAAGLTLDYSKNHVTEQTLQLLTDAVVSEQLQDKAGKMFSGERCNTTEDREVLHLALRDFNGRSPCQDEIEKMFDRMSEIVKSIHSGSWTSTSGKAITDIVNIGIGGSHLGPMMATAALASSKKNNINCHFVSNIDSVDLHATLAKLSPETTLFIIASKSFTTLETLHNATIARQWLAGVIENPEDISRHFIAITSKIDKAVEFGISSDNILPMWDWVGGRYSLWSAIGLSIALSIGMNSFIRLRKGAADMDQHFLTAPPRQNLPVLLGMLGIWYINYWGAKTHAVLPYSHYLRYLPEFLQQLEMESNGKSTRIDNQAVDYQTSPVIWGTVETNGQHSYHQMLHQGTQLIPVDFILSLNSDDRNDKQHPYLVANCLAQSNTLMVGREYETTRQEGLASGLSEAQAEKIARHRQMSGNRPSTTIVMDRLTPETLGALIALYEHKVYVQSVIWQINAFDQFGVELGKENGNRIYQRLTNNEVDDAFDSSTEGLIKLYKESDS